MQSASRLTRIRIACALATAAPGCATILTLSPDRVEPQLYEYESQSVPITRSVPRVYSGVATDALCVWHKAPVLPLCIVDLPFSLVGDTIALPFTVWQQIKFGNFRSRLLQDDPRLVVFRAWLQRDRQACLDACHRVLADGPPTHRDAFRDFCLDELAAEEAARQRSGPVDGRTQKLLAGDGGTPSQPPH